MERKDSLAPGSSSEQLQNSHKLGLRMGTASLVLLGVSTAVVVSYSSNSEVQRVLVPRQTVGRMYDLSSDVAISIEGRGKDDDQACTVSKAQACDLSTEYSSRGAGSVLAASYLNGELTYSVNILPTTDAGQIGPVVESTTEFNFEVPEDKRPEEGSELTARDFRTLLGEAEPSEVTKVGYITQAPGSVNEDIPGAKATKTSAIVHSTGEVAYAPSGDDTVLRKGDPEYLQAARDFNEELQAVQRVVRKAAGQR